jgi:hypothetical protein
MSKFSKAVSGTGKVLGSEKVTNFMGGTSYTLDPIQTLKMIAASSIFGEPQYYRKSGFGGKSKIREGLISYSEAARYMNDILFKELVSGRTATQVFTDAIDNALSYDFYATLKLAVELRDSYFMRLNPQVIMVRAAIHPDREKFSKKHPGVFAQINAQVMSRADEPATQIAYYLYLNDGKKNDMPSILKRSLAKKLSSLDRYAINKYKNAEIGMINAVRITHASSPLIDELMKTGSVEVEAEEETWEQKRSAGMDWKEIFNTTKMGHMAILRNLRNIFTDIDRTDSEFADKVLTILKKGVLKGKQFPFRYYNAFTELEKANINFKIKVLDAVQECLDISIANMPKLKGRTMCLSDNSGSAWGAVTSEYGTTKIAVIDNLSSVIAGACSEEGYVGKFGDALRVFPVSKRDGILTQANAISKDTDEDVGGATEGGIWIFFHDAIKNKEHYDNIFIFSDQQAGTGGLYGTMSQYYEYGKLFGTGRSKYIDVYKLIQKYRQEVNPKVNVFSIQTAGYDNVLIPAMAYRTAILTGWTGKEIQFASKYIEQWDDIDAQKESKEEASVDNTPKKRKTIDDQVNEAMKHLNFKSKEEADKLRNQIKASLLHDAIGDKDSGYKKKYSDKSYNKKRDYKKYKK